MLRNNQENGIGSNIQLSALYLRRSYRDPEGFGKLNHGAKQWNGVLNSSGIRTRIGGGTQTGNRYGKLESNFSKSATFALVDRGREDGSANTVREDMEGSLAEIQRQRDEDERGRREQPRLDTASNDRHMDLRKATPM
jgi:hypothetical protein